MLRPSGPQPSQKLLECYMHLHSSLFSLDSMSKRLFSHVAWAASNQGKRTSRRLIYTRMLPSGLPSQLSWGPLGAPSHHEGKMKVVTVFRQTSHNKSRKLNNLVEHREASEHGKPRFVCILTLPLTLRVVEAVTELPSPKKCWHHFQLLCQIHISRFQN